MAWALFPVSPNLSSSEISPAKPQKPYGACFLAYTPSAARLDEPQDSFIMKSNITLKFTGFFFFFFLTVLEDAWGSGVGLFQSSISRLQTVSFVK